MFSNFETFEDVVKENILHDLKQWPQDWKRSVFIPIPKKGNAKDCSNYRTIALIYKNQNIKEKKKKQKQYVNKFNKD